ncbi:MAG: ribbon-helix-helix protein, CopG family [Hyphomonadaceae bacterium]
MAQTRITVTVDDDQHAAISEIAEVEGRGLSDIVREALADLIASRWPENIQETATRAIVAEGMTNQEALEEVLKRHGDRAMTSLASIAWYRTKLRKLHPEVRSDAQIKLDRKKAKSKKK